MPEALLWAPRAWVAGGWQNAVLLRVDANGCWAEITPGVNTAPAGATVLAGPVLPGLVNAHSHAFQRAFAGLAERRESEADDFWSWRDRMYGVALRITPEQLQAVAAQLYVELLRGGYTQVCEFHYLQHAEDGQAYADPARLSWSLADAAADAGIGLTVLPVLYERAGFKQPTLRPDQRRFASSPASVLALQRRVMAAHRPLVNAGVAVHSLRAASPASMVALMQGIDGDDMPIHIHVAEQMQEVDDCVVATGARPIEWLYRELKPDARWQLVHATHADPAEIDQVAESGAGIVLCPSTEANLGDGLTDLPHWLACQVPMAIGSDSQVSRSWAEELRWLEYGQRLLRRERNVSAAPHLHAPSTAASLFNAALAGGARAAGQPAWGLVPGARADALVLDPHTPGLLGVAPSHALDAWVFAADAPVFQSVYVAGRQVVAQGRHADEARIARNFGAAMASLWENTAAD
jgi:formimidoylglutamate deiminase